MENLPEQNRTFSLYLDVTSTSVTHTMTGIPRVVRNLANASTEFEVSVVEFDGMSNSYFRISHVTHHDGENQPIFIRKMALRLFKEIGEIPIISTIATRILRNRIVFYFFRRIFGRPSNAERTKIDILSGVLLLPEVPLNRAHGEKIQSLVESGSVKLALFVHDLLPLSHPEHFSKDLVWKFQNYTRLFALASEIIVSNEDVAQELQQKVGPKSLHVVSLPTHFPLAPRESFEQHTFLAVGTIEPRKNLIRTLQSFEQYHRKFPQSRLIIIGNPGWQFKPIVKYIRRLQHDNVHIDWLQNVSDEELLRYYRTSTALIYPSLFEGYGLPVIEALSQSCPVITSDRPVLRRFAVYGGVELINPESVEDITRAMEKLSDRDVNQSFSASIKMNDLPANWNTVTSTIYSLVENIGK